jgi:D-sedoheptulose 7-phosphate isomerase
MDHTQAYLEETSRIAAALDRAAVDRLVEELVAARDRGGRVFVLGVGGGAGNAGHAVNDLRKLCGLEAYAPTDNVSELTARVNDDGWESTFARWLETSRLAEPDLVLVFSVGGGDRARNVSPNLVAALELAVRTGARIAGIVGRDGGFLAEVAHAAVIVPTVNPAHVTPHTEAFQAVLWHLAVSHPRLQRHAMKWESVR